MENLVEGAKALGEKIGGALKRGAAVVAGVGTGAMVSFQAVGAQAFDVSDAVDTIGDGATPAAAIGVALVSLAGIFLVWRWIKGSMF